MEHSLWLRSLFVSPPHRRQGLGQALLCQVMQETSRFESSLTQLVAFVPTPYQGLYQSVGFHPADESKLPAPLQKRWQQAVDHAKPWHLYVYNLPTP
ncbi:hypothetical protein AVO41_08650 [Thiomicrospira sp. WB1]|nr:hypothetical protein AVO41_08650 [Thiomicrospira sp. WB1]